MKLILVVLVFCSQYIYADFPKNDLRFPKKTSFAKSVFSNEITEFKVNQMASRFIKLWSSDIESIFKKKLIINIDWSNDRVNAHATRDKKRNLIINLLGGMVRHPEMTEDALLFILCHELGHHLGGAPKKFRGTSSKRSWSSIEGQADYFAASKCLPKVFANKDETKILERVENFRELDLESSPCKSEQCQRVILAGLAIGKVFATLRDGWSPPSLVNPSSIEVLKTNQKHPEPQCRLDTIISGVLCHRTTKFKEFDNLDPKKGACNRPNFNEEARPKCWFNSQKY